MCLFFYEQSSSAHAIAYPFFISDGTPPFLDIATNYGLDHILSFLAGGNVWYVGVLLMPLNDKHTFGHQDLYPRWFLALDQTSLNWKITDVITSWYYQINEL